MILCDSIGIVTIDPQRDAMHPVDEGYEDDHARPARVAPHAAEAEEDATLCTA